jgi:hypothetical protein
MCCSRLSIASSLIFFIIGTTSSSFLKEKEIRLMSNGVLNRTIPVENLLYIYLVELSCLLKISRNLHRKKKRKEKLSTTNIIKKLD